MVTYDFMASNVFAQKSKTTPPHINSDQDPGIEPDTSDTGVFFVIFLNALVIISGIFSY